MEIRGKKYKFTEADLRAGTKHEMEHTNNKSEAKKIALAHLRHHYTYYRVLPVAEQMMTIQESKDPLKQKKKRRHARPAGSPLPNFGFKLGF